MIQNNLFNIEVRLQFLNRIHQGRYFSSERQRSSSSFLKSCQSVGVTIIVTPPMHSGISWFLLQRSVTLWCLLP